MLSPCRVRLLFALLLGGGVFLFTSRADALPEKDVRDWVQRAEKHEINKEWDQARQIYELLLGQNDPGLRIRERYQNCLRRCWQAQRHSDPSYTKEVLSVDFGQALHVAGIINNTLLDGAYNKKKMDPVKLLKKGIDELDTALSDPNFQKQHIPFKQANVPIFRAYLQKTARELGGLSRKDALERISKIAMDAEDILDMNPTVAIMEMACGACYAIDEYTVYLTPNQLRELAQSLTATDANIGADVDIMNNKIVVKSLTMDGPAARQFVMIGDEILSIDGMAVADMTLAAVKEKLKGQADSMVMLEVQAATDDAPRTVRLTRQAPTPTVAFYPLQGTNYFHLKISTFTDATIRDFDQFLKQPGMKGLVLDLRQNGGGVVESAIETAQKFLTNGVIASRVDSAKNFVYHAKNPNASNIPLVVLVDNDTASAAEILAGALKDNNRATLIGQTTFGKGCTQCILRIQDAAGGVPTGGMRLTVARFFSPKGIPYTGRGVVPHIFIDEQMANSRAAEVVDPYLDRAITELNRMLASPK